MKTKNFDTQAFGREVKKSRSIEQIPIKNIAVEEHITPRHLRAIENQGQSPSLNLLGSLCKRFDISADQFIFPKNGTPKDAMRRHIERQLDGMKKNDLDIVEGTINGILKSKEKP